MALDGLPVLCIKLEVRNAKLDSVAERRIESKVAVRRRGCFDGMSREYFEVNVGVPDPVFLRDF